MNIKISNEEKPDWSMWRRYKTPTGIEIVVTSAFLDVMENGQENLVGSGDDVSGKFLRLLHKYRKSFKAHRYDEYRQYIAEWQNAVFYGINESNIGVREEKEDTWSNEDMLERMDWIRRLLELGWLPHWIKTPAHYGMIKYPQIRRWYYRKSMVIQKIDSGVTALDIIDGPRNNNEWIRKAILESFPTYNFWEIGDENYELFRQEIRTKYVDVFNKLKQTFDQHRLKFPGWTFQTLFADLFQRNLIVVHNENLVGGSRVNFWIIDQ